MTEMSVLIRMSVGINEGTKRVKGYQTETARSVPGLFAYILLLEANSEILM